MGTGTEPHWSPGFPAQGDQTMGATGAAGGSDVVAVVEDRGGVEVQAAVRLTDSTKASPTTLVMPPRPVVIGMTLTVLSEPAAPLSWTELR
jgi:hypothetical protein